MVKFLWSSSPADASSSSTSSFSTPSRNNSSNNDDDDNKNNNNNNNSNTSFTTNKKARSKSLSPPTTPAPLKGSTVNGITSPFLSSTPRKSPSGRSFSFTTPLSSSPSSSLLSPRSAHSPRSPSHKHQSSSAHHRNKHAMAHSILIFTTLVVVILPYTTLHNPTLLAATQHQYHLMQDFVVSSKGTTIRLGAALGGLLADPSSKIVFSSSHHSLLNEYSYRFLNGSQAIPKHMLVRESSGSALENELDGDDDSFKDSHDYNNNNNNNNKYQGGGSWLNYKLPVTHLKSLQKDCTTLRYFSEHEIAANPNFGRLGIEFVEFVPKRSFKTSKARAALTASSSSSLPTFHWIEFLILAYTQLQQIHTQQVAWIHVPHAVEQCADEIPATTSSDSATKINCLVAQYALGDPHGTKTAAAPGNEPTLSFYGREANSYDTALSHPQLHQPLPAAARAKRPWLETIERFLRGVPSDLDIEGQQTRHETMMESVDAVLTLQRPGCRVLQQQQPGRWMNHLYHFSPHQWHADISHHGLQLSPLPQREKQVVIRIGYLGPHYPIGNDGKTTTHRFPQEFHELLLASLREMPKKNWETEYATLMKEDADEINKKLRQRPPTPTVEFVYLNNLDQLPTEEQLRTTAQLDILIGLHDDSLSHLFFMPPDRAVVELFWETPFEFEFATASQMMMHDYLAVYNGLPLDSKNLANHDLDAKKEYSPTAKPGGARERKARMDRGVAVVGEFVEQSVHRIAALRRGDFLYQPE